MSRLRIVLSLLLVLMASVIAPSAFADEQPITTIFPGQTKDLLNFTGQIYCQGNQSENPAVRKDDFGYQWLTLPSGRRPYHEAIGACPAGWIMPGIYVATKTNLVFDFDFYTNDLGPKGEQIIFAQGSENKQRLGNGSEALNIVCVRTQFNPDFISTLQSK